MTIVGFLNKVNQFILNPIIALAFVVALLIFFWGIFEFIRAKGSGDTKDDGKSKIIWGVVGMLIMFSAYGIIRFILSLFGLSPTYPL